MRKFVNLLLCLIGISYLDCLVAMPRQKREFEDNDIYNFNCGGSELSTPLITPCKDSLKLEAGISYTLRCEGNEEIVWWHGNEGLMTSVPFENTEDAQRPFGIALEMVNVNVNNVGAYYCISASQTPTTNKWTEDTLVELVNNGQASTIYVFVNDKEQLLVHLDPIIFAKQFTEVIIPCKPAMPETEVMLTFNGDTFYSETQGRYDPKRGFVFEIRSLTDGGEYYCAPKIPLPDYEEESSIIDVRFIGNGHIDKASARLNKPILKSESNHYAYENESFELVCELSAPHGVRYDMQWVMPDKVEESRTIINNATIDSSVQNSTYQLGRSTLKVRNASFSDKGTYKCIVSDQNENKEFASYRMHIVERNSSYLNVSEPTNSTTVKGDVARTIQLRVNIGSHPTAKYKWYKPSGIEVWETETNFKIIDDEIGTTLQILSAKVDDSGTYVIKCNNGFESKELSFNVTVSSGPVLSMNDVYVVTGQEAHLDCSVKSFPPAVVTFSFKPCSLKPHWPTCGAWQPFSSKAVQEQYKYRTNTRPGALNIETIHEVIFMPTEPGFIACMALNTFNGTSNASTRAHVLLGNIAENITISGLSPQRKIAKGDEVDFTCAALAYHFDANLEWYHNGVLINDIQMGSNSTDYTYTKTLSFRSIADKDRGTYECRAHYINNPEKYDSREIDVYIHDPKAPQWINLDTKTKLKRNLGDSLNLECKTEAVPLATVSWFKDDNLIKESNRTHIIEDGTMLRINHLYPSDDGVYRCVAANRLGSIDNAVTVIITNIPGVSQFWIWLGCIFFVVLIALCAFLAVRYRQERKHNLALKAAGLANFMDGDVEQINPAMTLDEQAELLPYDRGFEFPREKLKLGKQLGAGAFGVVLKGEAEGIRNDEPVSIVAVKMVKRSADAEVVRALVSELKIMVHLGQHLNVVNLLGAVTKNIDKRELMVIVEYCLFGNIQNFLLRNRKCFINQINTTNDRIDSMIMTQRISDNFDLHRNSDNDPRAGTRAGRTVSGTCSYDPQLDTCATVMTTVPEDDHLMSNNSVQPAWRSNYKTDSTEAMTVTTSDLVSWCFQVARGMGYLSSKKVLHGDLAARNILLCEGNVVKICDFGLARSMYRGDNYKKSESGKLPIKWLALESLSDHVFSTYSDVWSFGIVMWEFFSLSKVPYPGIDPNQELFNKLNDGYRMEKPPYANQELYEIMLECWRKSPESRPLFDELEKRFGTMLGEDVATHYLDLNDPYMRSNTEYMKNRATDYLSLMGSPTELAPPAPRYVNGHIVPDIRIEESPDDYLQMSSEKNIAIFSPTRPNQNSDFDEMPAIQTSETSFTFPDMSAPQPHSQHQQQHSPTLANNMDSSSGNKPLRRKNGLPHVDAADQAPEEIPMLHATANSDGERSPEQSRRFPKAYAMPTASPRHHIETQLNGSSSSSSGGSGSNTGDNYVNVKPPRKNLVNKPTGGGSDAFSNPSYQPLAKVNEEERRY
ncbi:vascular endothelial growth factor receptor 1 isoform X9 [Drosophila grimshawi]|uniref:vascular endothelial growth factor receptor 1 isoform X9 n=1 Tax=Drosophila grimshawi TaxID=7222 RepID=UPI001C9332FD|nr:vascular endothelial growth factor receptor 1 isoform X9 [Drosophila grimshawi]